jgi:hypothetical protein
MVRCPVRHGLYFLTPEERVRQALIWFLIQRASNIGGWREKLRFEVEQRSLDVAAFLAPGAADDQFALSIPVLIVETKRLERDLTDDAETEDQLKTYMLRERCRSGLMFNARQATWLSSQDEFRKGRWSKDRLSDLSEVEQRLHQATAEATVKALNCKNCVARAAAGDFDSLIHLLALMGNDYRLTFTLSIRSRGNLGSVQAFGVRKLDADKVSYLVRGVISRNRQQLMRQDFHSLLAIGSIGPSQ